jgi:hypothetical protein
MRGRGASNRGGRLPRAPPARVLGATNCAVTEDGLVAFCLDENEARHSSE